MPASPRVPRRRRAAGRADDGGGDGAHSALVPSATRGSSSAYSRSTTVLTITNAATRTNEIPWTTAKSFGLCRLDEVRAEPVEAERQLHHRVQGDQRRDRQAGHRGNRDGRVAQHVAADDRPRT